MKDMLTVPELADTEFAFTDISKTNLEMVAALCKRDIKENKLPAKVRTSTNRLAMLEGADYVFCMIRQGGLEAFRTDIDIPLKYGVDQCVGDTLCAGGIMYAQRTIPVLLEFCREIRAVAKPDALFMNYANPMAMNTWACNRYGGVRTVGLCHGVQGAHWQITRCIESWAKKRGLLEPGETLHRKDVDVIAAGINHQTWFIKVEWRGIDFIPLLLELFEAHPEYSKTEKVRIDVLRRFGYYSTESNGHLSEYLPWYRKRTKEIPRMDRYVLAGSTAKPEATSESAQRAAIGLKPISRTGSRSPPQGLRPKRGVKSMVPISLRRWKQGARIGVTLTSRTSITSRTFRTGASSKFQAMSIGPGFILR